MMGWNPFERKKPGPAEQKLSPEQQKLISIIMSVAQGLAKERQELIRANLKTAPRVLVHPEKPEVLLFLGREVPDPGEAYIRVCTEALGDSVYYSTPVSTDLNREKPVWKLPQCLFKLTLEQKIDLARENAKPVPPVDTQDWRAVSINQSSSAK